MDVRVFTDAKEIGTQAAIEGAGHLRQAIANRGTANIIVATGASQFEMFSRLIVEPDIEWNRVTVFHLDEYVGLSISHPASFRQYLWKRFISQLPLPVRAFHFLNGEGDCQAECERVGDILRQHPIDVAFVGIGENGHLAFNDPPANFETEEPYMVVDLDEKCRQQQFDEGWFESFDSVPRQALSMSVQQILKSKAIVCTVPDERKASAVRATLEGEITPLVPASILKQHSQVTLYLDQSSASQLEETTVNTRSVRDGIIIHPPHTVSPPLIDSQTVPLSRKGTISER